MHFSTFILLSGLTAALAAPTELFRRTNTWTLVGFTATCIGPSCRYQYTIRDDSNGATSTCDYTKSERNFQRQPCAPGSPYFINQGYQVVGSGGPNDFIVVVPVNVGASKDAFFGYTIGELSAGKVSPDKTEPVNNM